MSDLIRELKREHEALLSAIGQVLKVGAASKEGRSLLLETKSLLLSHLAREDDALYPALWKASEDSDRLKLFLQTLSDEMKDIAETATQFFAAYEQEAPSASLGFELGKLLGTLRARIAKEESLLYPEYEKLLGLG